MLLYFFQDICSYPNTGLRLDERCVGTTRAGDRFEIEEYDILTGQSVSICEEESMMGK